MRNSILILLIIFSSCGKIEENSLLSDAESNSEFTLTKTSKSYTEKDSIWHIEKLKENYDSKKRLISSNDITFYFYNSKNKIAKTKYINRRGRVTTIIQENYIYNSKGNLVAVVRNGNSAGQDTLNHYKYDSNNNLTFEGNEYWQKKYKYSGKRLIEKQEIENGKVEKISNYEYYQNGKVKTEDWVFGDRNRMRTYFTYYPNGKLFSERDSSFKKTNVPNEFVEFKTEYYYLKNDSLSRKKELGRVFSEKEFKLRGYETYEYKKSNGL